MELNGYLADFSRHN